jgi:hypothetical protein
MISRLYQLDSTFDIPADCLASGRAETKKRFLKNGKIYTMVWRDKVTIEDPYLVMVKAAAYAIRMNEPYGARTPRRDYKDFLLRSSVVI